MLIFPHSKVNLGLYITEKREDGYHNIETVFHPVAWRDALEVSENKNSGALPFVFYWHEQNLEVPLEDQLIYKAWKLLKGLRNLPPIEVNFLKTIPTGAGLGGGSSDGAHAIQLLDQKFDLQLSEPEKLKLASNLGSDCAFFLKRKSQYAWGKGEQMTDLDLDLNPYYFLIVHPGVHSSTAGAYLGANPQTGRRDLREILKAPLETWKKELINDFEPQIFEKFPVVKELKNSFYKAGALYASMSGSGSAVYGIFEKKPDLRIWNRFTTYLQKPLGGVF